MPIRTQTPAEQVAERLTGMERRINLIDEAVVRTNQRALAFATTPDSGQQPVMLSKVIRGISSGDWRDAEYEESVVRPSERAALTTTSDTLGGYVVPAEFLPGEFVEMLYAAAVAFQAGVRRLNVNGGPVTIPTMESGSTTYWTAENAAITESNQTFGQLNLQPHALTALVKTSNRLLRMGTPDAESLIREDIANAIGVELDRAIWRGSGASGQPLGLLNSSGINTTSAGATLTLDLAWNMIYEIEVDNADKLGPMSWVMHPAQWHDFRKAADAAGQPKYYAGAGAPIAKEAYGLPVHTTTNLAEGTVVVGCMNQLVVPVWGGLQFLASQHAGTAFAADQTWIRAVMDVDVGVRQPLSFCVDTSFT